MKPPPAQPAGGWPGRKGQRRDERWLAQVWQQQAFNRRNLRTTSGLGFKVVFPGMCTGEAGPDFRDAILALADGSLVRGDVELHLESSGWRQHGHHRDPAYDRVLLHVVLEDDEPVRNAAGEPILTVELAGRLRPRHAPPAPAPELEPPANGAPPARHSVREAPATWLTVVPPLVRDAPPGPPAPRDAGRARAPISSVAVEDARGAVPAVLEAPAQLSYVLAPCRGALPRRGEQGLGLLLRELALERFHDKQAVFEGELAVFEPEQALYAAFLEALGYSRNQEPFRRLAEAVPLAALRLARTAEAMAALLLGAAGLAAGGAALMARAGLVGGPLPAGLWRTTGVRPENLPARRIRQGAAVLERLLEAGLLDELLGPLLELDGAAALDVRAGRRLAGVWRAQLADLGRQRADALAINVLLPFAAAYGQASCHFLLSELAIQAFLAYPAEGGNQVTGYMRRDILGELAGAAAGAAGEQALLHVWRRWCHEKVCALCPLGSRSRPAR
jgi:hypothetical protein